MSKIDYGCPFEPTSQDTIDKYGYKPRKIYSTYDGDFCYLVVDDIQGSNLCLPRKTRWGMTYGLLVYGCWEPTETEFVKRILKPGMNVIDVGAFVGYYTMMMAKTVGIKGNVYCYEPLEEGMRLVKKGAELNGYSNIIFYPNFVSNRIYTEHYDEYLLGASPSGSEVGTVTIDSTVHIKPVDFMKLDAIGYEPEVILGAKDTIEKSPDILIMLNNYTHYWGRRGITPKLLKEAFEEVGLKVFRMVNFKNFEEEKFEGLVYDWDPKATIEELQNSDWRNHVLWVAAKSKETILKRLKS